MTKEDIRSTAIGFIGLILLCILVFGIFRLERWINWTFGYGSSVEHTISKMVKTECLKENEDD